MPSWPVPAERCQELLLEIHNARDTTFRPLAAFVVDVFFTGAFAFGLDAAVFALAVDPPVTA